MAVHCFGLHHRYLKNAAFSTLNLPLIESQLIKLPSHRYSLYYVLVANPVALNYWSISLKEFFKKTQKFISALDIVIEASIWQRSENRRRRDVSLLFGSGETSSARLKSVKSKKRPCFVSTEATLECESERERPRALLQSFVYFPHLSSSFAYINKRRWVHCCARSNSQPYNKYVIFHFVNNERWPDILCRKFYVVVTRLFFYKVQPIKYEFRNLNSWHLLHAKSCACMMV